MTNRKSVEQRTMGFSLLIGLLISSLFACQKEKFQPCEDYDKLIGSWRSIDGDAKDVLEFTENGKYKYYSALERNFSYKMGYSEKQLSPTTKFGMNWAGYFYMNLSNNEDAVLFVRFNATFDTIIRGNGAFNHSDGNLFYDRRYVKIK